MSEGALSFGRKAVLTADPVEFLALERSVGLARGFDELDQLVTGVVRQMLLGERIAEVSRDRTDTVTLLGLDSGQRVLVDERFALEHQQSRGAWFLPEDVSLRAGLLNLPFYSRTYPRFASGLAMEERAKVRLRGQADVMLVWALLEPLAERLFQPIELRGPQVGLKGHDEQLSAWTAVDEFLGALGFDVSDELAVMRYGGGWSQLRSGEQVAAKQHLLTALGHQTSDVTASRYRVIVLRTLIQHYYGQAAKRVPTRRQALSNRALQRVLAAYFGGDWLAFLAYIGEAPHPDERIATALPETRLQVGGAARGGEVASELKLPATEVERMLAAYWDHPLGTSPVEERVEVLRRYWGLFDDLHARQASGMRPLWGLVEDTGFFNLADDNPGAIPYQDGLYRELLPADLVADIERLWVGMMLPRWPERIVTQQMPHLAFAETFGPALKFWHGCALTAWFICEGPLSRTDLPGMAHYYRDELAQLASPGCPVDESFFTDLLDAEKHLGPPEPIPDRSSTTEVTPGISVTVQVNRGERREGFERLRDIVTRYRRAWTGEHFERYVHARWESELRTLGREYSRLIEDKGKPPTPKQFASRASAATNGWFGGDISALYAALGEKVSLRPERVMLMPVDRATFAWSVFRELGGRPVHRTTIVATAEEGDEENEQWRVYSSFKRLAEHSLWFVQLKEALGRPPTLKEFGHNKFEPHASVLADNTDDAWERYRRTVDVSLGNQPLAQRLPRPVPVSTGVSDTPAPLSGTPLSPPAISPPETVPEPESARPWWKRLRGR